jgi:hypothetical protein
VKEKLPIHGKVLQLLKHLREIKILLLDGGKNGEEIEKRRLTEG